MKIKTFAISALTVFVQYYDYHLFAFLASNIAVYFFPDASVVVQLLNTYFLMIIAMVGKPIGAIIFGRIGDIVGRSNSFVISLSGAAIASFIIFITPSYEAIGLTSTFILLLCRMIICALVSSGSDGVRIFVFEHIKNSMQCFGMGVTTFFTLFGSLAASICATFFTSSFLSPDSWKYAFLVGSALSFFVIILTRVTNFQDKTQIKSLPTFGKFRDLSIYGIIKSHKKLFILSLLLTGSIGSTNQFILVFFGTYNFQILGTVSRGSMQLYISISIVIYMVCSIIGGFAADKIGKYGTAGFAAFINLLIMIIQGYYLSKNEFSPVLLFLTAAAMPFMVMPAAVIMTGSIPSAIRYRLFSISHALGSILISSPTAFIATFLYHKTHITWLPLCYFITSVLMISFTIYKLGKHNLLFDEDKNSL